MYLEDGRFKVLWKALELYPDQSAILGPGPTPNLDKQSQGWLISLLGCCCCCPSEISPEQSKQDTSLVGRLESFSHWGVVTVICPTLQETASPRPAAYAAACPAVQLPDQGDPLSPGGPGPWRRCRSNMTDTPLIHIRDWADQPLALEADQEQQLAVHRIPGHRTHTQCM